MSCHGSAYRPSGDLVLWISEGRTRREVYAARLQAAVAWYRGRLVNRPRLCPGATDTAPRPLVVVDARALRLQRLFLDAALTVLVLAALIVAGHLWSPHPAPPATAETDPGPNPLYSQPNLPDMGTRPGRVPAALMEAVVSGLRTQRRLLAQIDRIQARAAVLEAQRDRARAAARAAQRRHQVERIGRASRGRVNPGRVVDALYAEAKRRGVPGSHQAELVDTALAIIQVESAWRPRAVSDAGAVGLMQVMPTWHTLPGLARADCPGALADVETNLCAGLSVWLHYLRRCDGATECALAYYAGASTYSASADQYIARIREARS